MFGRKARKLDAATGAKHRHGDASRVFIGIKDQLLDVKR